MQAREIVVLKDGLGYEGVSDRIEACYRSLVRSEKCV